MHSEQAGEQIWWDPIEIYIYIYDIMAIEFYVWIITPIL